MREKRIGEISRRERLELIGAALVSGMLALVGPLAGMAGRLCWLVPFGALPVGLWLCRCWERLGTPDLGRGLEQAFGRWLGRMLAAGYFLWGLLLLAASARRYVERLSVTFREMPQWVLLLMALGLCLWLSRGSGTAFARGGRLFFLFLLVTLGAILFLALPGVDWRYLWPPERGDRRGLFMGVVTCLGLAGYGIYALTLPVGKAEEIKGWRWAVWGSGWMAAILFVTVGAFGPALTAELAEPFLSLLEGVKVPGAFRRGEAALAAVLIFGDLTLFGLLARGCKSLWDGLAPAKMEKWGSLFVAAAFLVVGTKWGEILGKETLLWGNLVAGVLIPTIAFFTKGDERRAHFVAEERNGTQMLGPKRK